VAIDRGIEMKRVLIVEDNETLRLGMRATLEAAGFEVSDAPDGRTALQHVESRTPAIVVSDLRMAPMDGLEVLREIKARRPEIEVLMVTAYGTIETAVEAMKAGANDFVTKPFSPDALELKVRRIADAIDERGRRERAEDETRYLREVVSRRFQVDEIVGDSEPMQAIFQQIRKVAPSEAAVLITGESGTGKELVARAIHRNSTRTDGPFVQVNCGALAEGVLESELFGHEKGAFTGAHRQRKGRFELADGGTLLLDEVGEVPPGTQVKLLRVLQEKAFERVGGEETLTTDVRILAATNRDLKAEVEAGRFREDLFYRLHVIPIHVPALRERPEDIVLLARFFLERMCRDRGLPAHVLSREAEELLVSYHWPGNVRELENVVERALVLTESETIDPSVLPILGSQDASRSLSLPSGDPPLNETLAALEKQLILRALARAGGVKAEAARRLGIKESALYYKLEKYGIRG
jgi:two-component system response regulator HydG